MKTGKRNLKLGVLTSYLWVIVHVGVNFVYAPLLLGTLGKSEYGLYQVIASFLAYINVLEASLSAGVLRFYCNAKAKNDEKYVQNVLAICKSIYRKLTLVIIGIGSIVLFGFRAFYSSSFTSRELTEGTAMLALLVFNICITMINALYLACIRGNERYVFEKLLSIISQILQPILCLLILYKFPYAIVVTFIQVLMNVTVSIIRYTYAKRELKVKVVLHDRNPQLERNILVFAGGLLLSNIADQIFWKTDQIILAKMFDTATVAVYAVGTQIYTNYMYVGTTVASVFFPKVSIYHQQQNGMKKISDLFIRVGRIAFILCFLVLSTFMIYGKEFIYFWVGEEYYSAYWVALIVMVPFTLDVIQNLGLTILQVIDKYSFRAKMYFVAAVLNIISTIILAKQFSGFGAALSTGITMFITSGIILNVYYYKTVHLDILVFWKNIIGMLVKFLPISIIAMVTNLVLGQTNSIIIFIIKMIVYVLIYSVVGYIFVMNEEEKAIVNKLFFKIIRKKKET